MVNVDLVALLAIQVLYAIASLALISVGLAIIFGMMRVINLAHGEFLMLGGYAAIVATSHGINIWIAILVVAPVVVGIIGVIVERTIIRFLYGRMVDTMLATWGLSLFLVGLTTAIFGNTTVGISAPLGSFQIGAYRTSGYTLFVIGVAVAVLAGIFAVLRWTRLGLIAARHHAERQHGGGARRQSAACLRRHFRHRRRLVGACRRGACAGLRRLPHHRRRLCREILHYRDRRRRGDSQRARLPPPRCSARSIRSPPLPPRRCSARSRCSPQPSS